MSLAEALLRGLLVGLTVLVLCGPDVGAQEAGDTGGGGEADRRDLALAARSIVSMGDTARLQQVLARGRLSSRGVRAPDSARTAGEAVTVGVIGGSITAGASASTPERDYGHLLAQWWRDLFPGLKVEFVNAGIGATGSNYGALRAQRDLLAKRPDFVVIEFGVNDPNSQEAAETLEGLVRQILSQPQQPAVVLLFTMNRAGGNAQEWQGKVGRHYGLPVISFRDALWPEIEAGRIRWEEVEADEVHPNDRGHAYMARFVSALLGRVLAEMPPDGELPPVKPTPQPLLSDRFEHVALYEADALKPVGNTGWTYEGENPWTRAWKADQPGSVIEFELEAEAILFAEYHVHGPMGKARVQVDDLPPTVVDAWFEPTWGGWRCTHELARGLGPGKHRVRVEIREEKNPGSEGHEFRVMGLGAAGLQ